MIITWMLASTALAVLLGVAAIAAERALRTVGREARGAWVFALAGAIGWPLLAPAIAAAFGRGVGAPAVQLPPVTIDGSTVVTFGKTLPALPPAWIGYLDVALIALWACASVLLIARLAIAMRALARVERSADREVIEGVPVLVTPSIGPAVFGAHRPRVLMPRWLFDLDAPLRALVVQHEQEHCRARDPQLTLAVAFAIALTPWNLGVWWIAKRLRLAVEVDCDLRVLRHANDSERYSRLLLFIAQRQSHVRLAPMLAESNSHLSRRIDAMNAPRPNNPRTRIAAFAVLAVCALAISTTFAKELTAAPTLLGDLQRTTPVAVPAKFIESVTPERKVLPERMPVLRTPEAPITDLQSTVVVPDSTPAVRLPDHPVMAVPGSPQPRYPDILKEAGVSGAALMTFVVNTDGTVDTSTTKIVYSTHVLFANALRAAAPNMRFRPAVLNGVEVRQLVQAPFVFNIAGSPLATAEGERATLERLMEAAGTNGLVTIGQVVITAMP